MLPFKAGLGMLIAATDVPVIPCYLHGCFQALRPETKWPKPYPIRIRIGTAMNFASVPNRREGWEQIAAELQSAVESLGRIPTT
jgi:1-acyl-sn-glycerol-3-phosphate acyltransferase